MVQLQHNLRFLITECSRLGIDTETVARMDEFIEAHEFEVCLDYIIDRVCELELLISREFIERVRAITREMGLQESTYKSIEGLVRHN